jgi:hypothetical protein
MSSGRHPNTRLPYSTGTGTNGTTLSLTGNVTGVTSHSDSANATLYVLGDTALNGVCHVNRLKSTLPAFFQSDERVKENFRRIDECDPFNAMHRIPGYTFDYKNADGPGIPHMGFKAQDIEPIFPFLVDDTDGTKYVTYAPMIAWNWEATKKLHERQAVTCQRISQLESENLHLQRVVEEIPRVHSMVLNLQRKVDALRNARSETDTPRENAQDQGPGVRNHRKHRHGNRHGRRLNLQSVSRFGHN